MPEDSEWSVGVSGTERARGRACLTDLTMFKLAISDHLFPSNEVPQSLIDSKGIAGSPLPPFPSWSPSLPCPSLPPTAASSPTLARRPRHVVRVARHPTPARLLSGILCALRTNPASPPAVSLRAQPAQRSPAQPRARCWRRSTGGRSWRASSPPTRPAPLSHPTSRHPLRAPSTR